MLMMVIPIPTPLLDVLLIVNISLALMILLIAMNTKDALNFRFSRRSCSLRRCSGSR